MNSGTPVLLPSSRSGLSALDVALRVVKEAGQTLVTRLHGEKEVSYKGRANLVSDVDKLVDGTLPQRRVLDLAPRPVDAETLRELFLDSMTLW